MIHRSTMGFLIADGARAQLLLRHSDGLYETVQILEADRDPHRPRTDSRTRVFSTAGRSAVEPDPRLAADRRNGRFATRLADALTKALEADRFRTFAVLAPARMLGPIREALGPPARHQLLHEVACDVTKLPKAALHQRLDRLALSPQEHAQ